MSEGRIWTPEIRVALDFDGTVVERGSYPKIGKDLGAIPHLLNAQKIGARFFLWTCRVGQEQRDAYDYLTRAGIVLHPPEFLQDGIKPVADIYLDDCNFEAPIGRKGMIWDYVGPNLLSAITELKERKVKYEAWKS